MIQVSESLKEDMQMIKGTEKLENKRIILVLCCCFLLLRQHFRDITKPKITREHTNSLKIENEIKQSRA